MTTPATNNDASPTLLTPRKIIAQVIGWLLGIALLALIIRGAIKGGDWSKIAHADPMLVAALLGCTIISTILNGTAFWITIQPLRKVRWRDMQWLNLVANMLNYAPVRLGAISRVMYNLRVDRLNLLQIAAWFALMSYLLFLAAGACLLATVVRDRIDWIWLALVLGQMVFGGIAALALAGHPLIARHARGLDQLFVNQRGLWIATTMRGLDIAAYCGRMAAALAIMDLHLEPSQVVKLALVVFISSLVPVGRLGFREWCVAQVAAGMGAVTTKGTWDQLALIESAGEALVFIPFGAVALLWFRARWVKSGTPPDEPRGTLV